MTSQECLHHVNLIAPQLDFRVLIYRGDNRDQIMVRLPEARQELWGERFTRELFGGKKIEEYSHTFGYLSLEGLEKMKTQGLQRMTAEHGWDLRFYRSTDEDNWHFSFFRDYKPSEIFDLGQNLLHQMKPAFITEYTNAMRLLWQSEELRHEAQQWERKLKLQRILS